MTCRDVLSRSTLLPTQFCLHSHPPTLLNASGSGGLSYHTHSSQALTPSPMGRMLNNAAKNGTMAQPRSALRGGSSVPNRRASSGVAELPFLDNTQKRCAVSFLKKMNGLMPIVGCYERNGPSLGRAGECC